MFSRKFVKKLINQKIGWILLFRKALELLKRIYKQYPHIYKECITKEDEEEMLKKIKEIEKYD